jgi:hypothetical protein
VLHTNWSLVFMLVHTTNGLMSLWTSRLWKMAVRGISSALLRRRFAASRALRATAARAFATAATAAYTPPPPAFTVFEAWLQQTARPLASPATVPEFLGSAAPAPQDRHDTTPSPELVRKFSALAQWAFKAHGEAAQAGDDARTQEILGMFQELEAWGNMAKGDVWHHFYIRQFFLSRAPLETYISCYELHRQAMETAGKRFLPLPSVLLFRELCWRGRFHEAVAAYTRLELSDQERRSAVSVLNEYEQYEAIREVYALQAELDQARGRATPLLDPAVLLMALKELGLKDELNECFESLPHETQARADLQKLIADA